MKTTFFRVFSLSAIISIFLSAFVQAQITDSASSGRNGGTPDEVIKAQARYDQLMSDAGVFFKLGLLYLDDNDPFRARSEFDKSIEVFLKSDLDVRSNAKLDKCYGQLIETIYRIEFAAADSKKPDLRYLGETCTWKFDNELVARIGKRGQPVPVTTNSIPTANPETATAQKNPAVQGPVAFEPVKMGLADQTYVPSPDEMAMLEPTKEEVVLADSPDVQQQVQYIQYVVKNNSLGGLTFQAHPMIQSYINHYMGSGRGTMQTGLARSGYFMMMARRIFREEGIPEYVAWLGQVESMWKPTAASWAAAKGLWQFIPGTGARYGLRINGYLDERSSFEKATHASAQYLKFLANRYNGNWELAMAAYNSGEGNVDRAIRRAGVANFWVAYPYLPRETRNYVPNILATILIANNPQKYGFGNVRPAAPLRYDQIRVPALTSLSLVAQAADTTVENLRFLNPELRTNMTPPEPYIIRVPQGKSQEVAGVIRRVPGSGTKNVAVANVLKGESAQDFATRTGSAPGNIVGPLPTQGKVLVKDNSINKIAYTRSTATPSPTARAKTVMAKAGESVAQVAARSGVSAVQLAQWNGLTTSTTFTSARELKLPPK